jgi:hypothetical protein
MGGVGEFVDHRGSQGVDHAVEFVVLHGFS